MNNWSRENIIWAAGYLEGEGFFVISFHPYMGLYVGAESTDKENLGRLHSIFGVGKVGERSARSNRLGKKPIYSYQVSSPHHVYAIAVAIYPFMSKRRKEQLYKLATAFIYYDQYKLHVKERIRRGK